MSIEVLRMVTKEELSGDASEIQVNVADVGPTTAGLGELLNRLRDSTTHMHKVSSSLAETLVVIDQQLADLKIDFEFWLDQTTDLALLRDKISAVSAELGNSGESRELVTFSAVYLGFAKIGQEWRLAVRYETERFESNSGELLDDTLVSESTLRSATFRIQLAAIQKMPEFLLRLNHRTNELVSIIENAAAAVRISDDDVSHGKEALSA